MQRARAVRMHTGPLVLSHSGPGSSTAAVERGDRVEAENDAVGSAVASTDLRRPDERPQYRALYRKAQEPGRPPPFPPVPFALLPNLGPSPRGSAMARFRSPLTTQAGHVPNPPPDA